MIGLGSAYSSRVLIREEIFPSPITCSTIDQSSSLLAVGLADGSIYVIDILTGQERATFIRHAGKDGSGSSINALNFYAQRYVISGALDGSLMINDLLRLTSETTDQLDTYSQYT